MSFDDFLAWAKLREQFADDQAPYLKECFEYANKQGGVVSYYFAPFQLQAYIYCLALHYIIITSAQFDPDLYKKYFDTDAGGAGGNSLSIIGSVSNATSSVSNMAYKGLQDLDLKNASLLSTPYGAEVAFMNNTLNLGIVLV